MKALVTGGGGFLGRRVVELLLAEGHAVSFLARGRYPHVEALGARGLQIDLSAGGAAALLEEALAGIDVIFHVAGKAGFWGPREEYFAINVEGTKNVIAAARAAGVPKLIYTSTPSVIGYEHDACGISSAPYAPHHTSFYPESKTIAEQLILSANSPELATVALRPHLIFGPGDNHLLPRIIQRARAGQLRIVGDGENRVDITFIDNAAWAHLDAARSLIDHQAPCAGRAYFISNNDPVHIWDWLNKFLTALGAPPITRRLSFSRATRIGAVMEWLWTTFKIKSEPRMTRFLASALARSHWYNMEPAAQDLDYSIRVPMPEATQRTIEYFRNLS